MQSNLEDRCPAKASVQAESGFTLIEVIIAMIILLVALLGVFMTISYAVNYNSGNSTRTKTLAVLQQEVERLRSAKWTPTFNDPLLLGTSAAGVPRTVTVDNMIFNITTIIDNDPATIGVQDEAARSSSATSFKEITVTARLASPSPGWQTAIPSTVILRRVKSN
jgi:prepilin-type N-terminal cleavage/methylation domain-containing protein